MEYQRWVKHDKRVTVERYRKRIQRGVWEAPAIELHSTLEKDEDGKTIRVYRRRAVNLALDRAILDCGMDRAMQAHFGGGSPGCPHCSPPMAEATPPGETDAAKSKRHWNARKNGSKHSIRHCIEICPHYKEAREEYGKSLKQAGIFCRQNFMRLTNMLDSDAAPQDKRHAPCRASGLIRPGHNFKFKSLKTWCNFQMPRLSRTTVKPHKAARILLSFCISFLSCV